MAKRKIGTIDHYYDKIGVAVIDLSAKLSIGDEIQVVGKKEEFTQTVDSLEVDHKKVKSASKGKSVGIKIEQKVLKGDKVFKN